ncbi:MAG: V-type ATP synthase subunit E family protein [Candidatus Omnitrophota bacterium]
MTEDLKGLIEKIQLEGVQVAEEKAKSIEQEARLTAQSIVENAVQESQKLLAAAREQIDKATVSAESSLTQAARDLLISLRKEISVILDRIIVLNVRKALVPQELSRIICALIKEYASGNDKGNILVSFNKDDLQALEQGLLSELKTEVKNKIVLASSDEIQAGFRISYDAGKSYYDFTDQALAEYISRQLEPHLAEILKKAALGKS